MYRFICRIDGQNILWTWHVNNYSRRCPPPVLVEIRNSAFWPTKLIMNAGATMGWKFLGTDSIQQQRISVWIGRASGTLGLVDALYILGDCWRFYYSQNRRRRQGHSVQHNFYRELMILVACFDAITGIIWMVGSAVVPTTLPNGDKRPMYGAHGNEWTCKVGGFVYSLGYGSIYSSVALSVYYYLVICRNYKKADLLSARKWLIGIPVFCALAMAVAAWPYYGPVGVGCAIRPEPYQDSKYVTFFLAYPILFTVVAATIFQILIFCKVRKQIGKSLRWRFPRDEDEAGNDQSNQQQPNLSSFLFRHKAEAAVFWQSLSYLSTFYVCWFLVAVLLGSSTQKGWGPWIMFFILAPLPGFLNCLIFFRFHLVKELGKSFSWKQASFLKKSARNEAQSPGSSAPPLNGTAPDNCHETIETPGNIECKDSFIPGNENRVSLQSLENGIDPDPIGYGDYASAKEDDQTNLVLDSPLLHMLEWRKCAPFKVESLRFMLAY